MLEDGHALEVPAVALATNVSDIKDSSCANVTSSNVFKSAYLFPLEIPLQFVPGVSTVSQVLELIQKQLGLDGNKRATRRDGKPFQFVLQPSTKHLKKMEENWIISCSILKYMKVPAPKYGMVITICTPGSLDRKELYEVSISDYPSYSYHDFKFMKVRANQKQK